MKKTIFILAFIISILFGSSYQQFRHFDTTDPRGMNDSVSYINMSQGEYDVIPVHKYRFAIPYLAGIIDNLILSFNPNLDNKNNISIRLSFYIINFIILTFSAYLLYLILEFYKFNTLTSLIGLSIFLSSRVVVYSAATPLIESYYILSLTSIFYLMIRHKVFRLAIVLPILTISKETILPFLFLPLTLAVFRNKIYYISIVLSILVFVFARKYIDLNSNVNIFEQLSFIEVISQHVESLKNKVFKLFTFKGVFDFIHGFSLFLIFALHGIYINYKIKLYNLPNTNFIAIILVSILFMFLSGNFGRMLFTAYIPIIVYVLISVEYLAQHMFVENQ
jgi:hypothetical protein